MDGGDDNTAAQSVIDFGEDIVEAIEASGLLTVDGLDMVLTDVAYGDSEYGLFHRELLERNGLLVPVVNTVWAEVR